MQMVSNTYRTNYQVLNFKKHIKLISTHLWQSDLKIKSINNPEKNNEVNINNRGDNGNHTIKLYTEICGTIHDCDSWLSINSNKNNNNMKKNQLI